MKAKGEFSMYDESKLKARLYKEFDQDEKMSSILILTIVSISLDIFLFMYKNCKMSKALIKNSARKKGFLYRKFLKNQVYPAMQNKQLSSEEQELAIEKIRQLIINDELDEFINENQVSDVSSSLD